MEMACTQGAIWAEPAGDEAESCRAWPERERGSDEHALRGDSGEAAILALYREYRPRIYRYLRSMQLRHEEAEEIVQEAFMRLTMELLKETKIANAPGWMVRVARNLALNLQKKEQGPVLAVETDSHVLRDQADSAPGPEEMYLKTEQTARMHEELARLKTLHRECFQMRAQGFGYRDIGVALGISKQRAAFLANQVAVRLAAVCE
jgi:RNA polymerase sigma-70 factor (ECF subfamily)